MDDTNPTCLKEEYALITAIQITYQMGIWKCWAHFYNSCLESLAVYESSKCYSSAIYNFYAYGRHHQIAKANKLKI